MSLAESSLPHRAIEAPVSDAPGKRDVLRFWGAYSACFGLLLIRGWDRISHAQLFAEDLRFVGQALNDGWASLLQPYDFFFHTIPRLIAILSVELAPVSHIPLSTNLACYALTAAAMANVSRSAYAWLIPSHGARIALALLLPLAPGLIETLGNIAGIHWSLLFWLAALCLKDPRQPFRVWELVLVTLISLTVAATIVFLPIVFLRLLIVWQGQGRPSAGQAMASGTFRRELVFFAVLFLVSAYLMFNFVLSEEKVGTDKIDIVAHMRSVDALLLRLRYLFGAFYFLHPFLGTHHTSLAVEASTDWPLFTTAVVVVSVLLWRLKQHLDERFWLVPVWIACLFLFATMLSFVRYWSFYGLFSPPYWDWWFRYNFIFASSALFFWFMLLRPTVLFSLRRWRSVATLVLVGAYILQADTKTVGARPPHRDDGFAIKRYGDTDWWSKTSGQLESAIRTGCPASVTVRSYPGGRWRFIYESPTPAKECKEN